MSGGAATGSAIGSLERAARADSRAQASRQGLGYADGRNPIHQARDFGIQRTGPSSTGFSIDPSVLLGVREDFIDVTL